MEHWFINGHGVVRSGWKASGFFLLLLTLVVVAGMVQHALGLPQGLDPWLGAGLGGLASLVCVKLEGRSFRGLGFMPGWRWLFECLVGALAGSGLILATALLVWGWGGFLWERTAGVGARQLLASAWPLLGVAFSEELFARGYPFQRLVEGAGPWVGQLLLAALFVLLHWNNPGMHGSTKAWASLGIGLAAILLGFCYLRTQSLALPIGLHLGWNWAQGSLLGFGVSGTTTLKGLWTPVFQGRPEWLTGGAFGLEASLPCALVCGAAILAAWHWKGSRPPTAASTAKISR
jgi:hypothetical protein